MSQAISLSPAPIPVIVVSFRNAGDVVRCLRTLAALAPQPEFAVYICENGGEEAFDALLAALTGPDGPCASRGDTAPPPRLRRTLELTLPRAGLPAIAVHAGEACHNLGYAGGVNVWLRALAAQPWPGIWVLNPDTMPDRAALAELVAEAKRSGAGLVGSQITGTDPRSLPTACGLAWRRWRGATANVCDTDANVVRRIMQAPSGASMYATRSLIDHIGVMEEGFFLYFEDLDWGVRARAHGGVAYAERSRVAHAFGTTIGSAASRRNQSALSVYLDFRNRLLFVRRNFPAWLAWTALMEIVEIAEYARLMAFSNTLAALRGFLAGVRGQGGAPASMLARHAAPHPLPARPQDGPAKRCAKLAISLIYYGGIVVARALRAGAGRTEVRRLCVLFYHAVRDEERPAFARQMAWLARHARIVPASWPGEAPGPASAPAVALTFDDAFESVAANALPTLREHGLPCTIFVPSGYLGREPGWRMETCGDQGERVMTAAQLRDLASPLVELGSHSVTHPHMTALPLDAARWELARSRDDLTALLGRPPSLFAFPYGDVSCALIDLCRSSGYAQVFTIIPKLVNGPDDVRGRIEVSPADSLLTFRLKARGAYAWMTHASALKRAVLGRARPPAAAPVETLADSPPQAESPREHCPAELHPGLPVD